MKKIGHFSKSFNLVRSKNFFRLNIYKSVKASYNLIFPKHLVVLGKWGAGRGQYNIWINSTNHFFIMFDFYKSLTPFEFRQISQIVYKKWNK